MPRGAWILRRPLSVRSALRRASLSSSRRFNGTRRKLTTTWLVSFTKIAEGTFLGLCNFEAQFNEIGFPYELGTHTFTIDVIQ